MTVVFGSRHFDGRRSRNGEISFLDLSALFAALIPVEMTVLFGSRHFDCRRSRNGEILFRDLSTPVEMTV